MIGRMSRVLERADHREPDGSATNHERHIVGRQSRHFDGMQTYRHRFGQRRMFGRQSVRYREQQRLPSAPSVPHSRPELRSNSRPSPARRCASRIGNEQTRVPACRRPRGLRTVVENSAQNSCPITTSRPMSMPMPPGAIVDELFGVFQRVQVRAADPARERFDEHFAGPGIGSGISSVTIFRSRMTAARIEGLRSMNGR